MEITQVNKEIELLKAKLETRKELCDNLQQRIDKAIEYIKRDDIFVEQENNGGRDIEGNLILIKYSVKLNLLKILGDKE